MTRYEIIGIGSVGSALAYSMMLMSGRENTIILTEIHEPNRSRALGEYYDLLPVAACTKNKIKYSTKVTKDSDVYVVTAGVRRTNTKQKKSELAKENIGIVYDAVRRIPQGKTIYIGTNPPIELCGFLRSKDMPCYPLRDCTDMARKQAGNPKDLNNKALSAKGYTQFTPAYAMASRVLFRG